MTYFEKDAAFDGIIFANGRKAGATWRWRGEHKVVLDFPVDLVYNSTLIDYKGLLYPFYAYHKLMNEKISESWGYL